MNKKRGAKLESSAFNGVLSRSNISGKILNDIRKNIIMQKYPPGTKLTEMFICEKYEISRQLARAIMQQLEKEGHLSMLANGSKITVDFTLKDLNDLYALRNYLEMTSVKEFLNSSSKNYVPLIRTLEETEKGDEKADYIENDILFHRSIIETSNNKYSLLTYDNISSTLYTIFALSIVPDPKDFYSNYTERHSALIRTLLSGSEEECLEIFRKHHEYALKKAINIVENLQR